MNSSLVRVLVTASEAVPFAKVGGLADLVGALSKEVNHSDKIDIRVIIPKYQVVKNFLKEKNIKVKNRKPVTISLSNQEIHASIEEIVFQQMTFYFVDYPDYFDRAGIYVDMDSKFEYQDSLDRFTFFSKAVFEAMKVFDFKPDIIHAHDWQTGLVPVYLKTIHKLDNYFQDTKSIFTIHNIAYQGIFSVEQYSTLGLDWKYFTIDRLEYYGHINLMKGGLVFSDYITTVSLNYSKEIQNPEYGNGLEGVTAEKAENNRLNGIMNGVDYEEWSPNTDYYLKESFNINYNQDSLDKKEEIKKIFLENNQVGYHQDRPLIGMISRLFDQKGLDLILEIFPKLLKMDLNIVFLGTGKPEYEDRLANFQKNYPDKVLTFIEFNIPLSHHIIAASDMTLMPSRFEPCGQIQLYSMKYGTLPIVRNTGGLADTVNQMENGFLFDDYNPDRLFETIQQSIDLYRNDRNKWKSMMTNAMNENWSWRKAAEQYIELFHRLQKENTDN